MKYLFLDTNFLLHFKSFDEINWISLLDVDNATVVIPLTVTSELDKHKQDSVSRIRKRARSTLKKIESYFDNGRISDNISVEVLTNEPKSQIFDSYNLEKDVPDDRILASMLELKIKNKDVCLVSNDSTIRLKAKSRNIEVFKIPKHLELQNQIDPVEKENQQLKRELERMRNSRPQLKVLFRDGKEHKTINLKKLDIKLNENDLLKKVKKFHPHMNLVQNDDPEKNSPFQVLANFNQPTSEKISEYNAKLDEYYEEYSYYLKMKHLFLIRESMTFTIELDLKNYGNAPAEDIDIFIHFPDGFDLCHPDEVMEKPEEPSPPLKPKNRLDFSYYPSLPKISQDLFQSPISPGTHSFSIPTIKKTNSYDVNYSVNSLKHSLNYELDGLVLTFSNYDSAKNFKIDYEISCANITEIVKGTLNVIVKK